MPQIQTTLPEVLQEEIIREPQKKYFTKYFEVIATAGQLTKCQAECDKKTRQGMPYYTEDEKRKIRMVFVQKKMRCVSVWPLFNSEWSESLIALYREIFQEIYGR